MTVKEEYAFQSELSNIVINDYLSNHSELESDDIIMINEIGELYEVSINEFCFVDLYNQNDQYGRENRQ